MLASKLQLRTIEVLYSCFILGRNHHVVTRTRTRANNCESNILAIVPAGLILNGSPRISIRISNSCPLLDSASHRPSNEPDERRIWELYHTVCLFDGPLRINQASTTPSRASQYWRHGCALLMIPSKDETAAEHFYDFQCHVGYWYNNIESATIVRYDIHQGEASSDVRNFICYVSIINGAQCVISLLERIRLWTEEYFSKWLDFLFATPDKVSYAKYMKQNWIGKDSFVKDIFSELRNKLASVPFREFQKFTKMT